MAQGSPTLHSSRLSRSRQPAGQGSAQQSGRGRIEGDASQPIVWGRDVPKAMRSLDTLTSPDYADVITTTTGSSERSAEQWLLAMVEGVPAALRLFIPLAQRSLLGLRVGLRSSPDHILGWKIAERGDGWLRIEAASWFLTGHCVLRVDDRQLSFATFVRYDRRPAALVWPPVSLIHRRVLRALMRGALRAQHSTPAVGE